MPCRDALVRSGGRGRDRTRCVRAGTTLASVPPRSRTYQWKPTTASAQGSRAADGCGPPRESAMPSRRCSSTSPAPGTPGCEPPSSWPQVCAPRSSPWPRSASRGRGRCRAPSSSAQSGASSTTWGSPTPGRRCPMPQPVPSWQGPRPAARCSPRPVTPPAVRQRRRPARPARHSPRSRHLPAPAGGRRRVPPRARRPPRSPRPDRPRRAPRLLGYAPPRPRLRAPPRRARRASVHGRRPPGPRTGRRRRHTRRAAPRPVPRTLRAPPCRADRWRPNPPPADGCEAIGCCSRRAW